MEQVAATWQASMQTQMEAFLHQQTMQQMQLQQQQQQMQQPMQPWQPPVPLEHQIPTISSLPIPADSDEAESFDFAEEPAGDPLGR